MALDSSEILPTLQGLPPRHFEQFVADVWQEQQGWSTEVMDKGPDRGLDVMGEPPGGGPLTALQCKRYAAGNKVTSSDIQQYAVLRQQWSDVSGVTVVTTSSFTKDAEELAERLEVKCLDGDDLSRLVKKYNAEEILNWYAQGKPSDW
jgi:restriction endonuclease Mrr